jgi:hypothetical protein
VYPAEDSAWDGTHVAVATDHVIESFRNELWPGYKTGKGIDADLLTQFPLLEETLSAAAQDARVVHFKPQDPCHYPGPPGALRRKEATFCPSIRCRSVVREPRRRCRF